MWAEAKDGQWMPQGASIDPKWAKTVPKMTRSRQCQKIKKNDNLCYPNMDFI